MKRQIAWILVLTLLPALSACGAKKGHITDYNLAADPQLPSQLTGADRAACLF